MRATGSESDAAASSMGPTISEAMATTTRRTRTRPEGKARGGVEQLPVSYLIANVARAVSREIAAVRLPGIAVPQVAPLLLLSREPGLSNAQLARRLHVSPQSMNEVIIDLEHAGLIRRRVDGANRRILRAELTAAGRKQMARWDKAIEELEARLFDGLSERQIEAMAEALRRCIENTRPGAATRPS